MDKREEKDKVNLGHLRDVPTPSATWISLRATLGTSFMSRTNIVLSLEEVVCMDTTKDEM